MKQMISFTNLLNILKQTDHRITDETLSIAFDISSTTIQRWRSGKTHSRELPNSFTPAQVIGGLNYIRDNYFNSNNLIFAESLLMQFEEYFNTNYWTQKYQNANIQEHKFYELFQKEIIDALGFVTSNVSEIPLIKSTGFDEILSNKINLSLKQKKTTLMSSGFETSELYHFILTNCQKRLWVLGRKNKKLFDRSNVEMFKQFSSDKIDFRFLFLDPNSPELLINSAQIKTNFISALQVCICDAYDLLTEVGLHPERTCRNYSTHRNEAIIIFDDIIMWTYIRYDDKNRPQHLTNSSFFISNTQDEIGQLMENIFLSHWTVTDNKENKK